MYAAEALPDGRPAAERLFAQLGFRLDRIDLERETRESARQLYRDVAINRRIGCPHTPGTTTATPETLR